MTCTLRALQGDVHGCPYKTLDKESLRAALLRLRVDPAAVEETVTKAKVRPGKDAVHVAAWHAPKVCMAATDHSGLLADCWTAP
jgi:hypothetical protein